MTVSSLWSLVPISATNNIPPERCACSYYLPFFGCIRRPKTRWRSSSTCQFVKIWITVISKENATIWDRIPTIFVSATPNLLENPATRKVRRLQDCLYCFHFSEQLFHGVSSFLLRFLYLRERKCPFKKLNGIMEAETVMRAPKRHLTSNSTYFHLYARVRKILHIFHYFLDTEYM